MLMETGETADLQQECLNGRILEIESHSLLNGVLTLFSRQGLSDEDYRSAMECLMQRWVYMMFLDCPDMIDPVLDSVGQFVCEDIEDVCGDENSCLN